jgi:hypothetical protein
MDAIDTYLEIEEIEDNFVRVPKLALRDKNLSLKAKGLYAYLAAMPKDWKLYRSEMLKHVSDGKDSLNAAFKEIEKFGYLTSTPVRQNGQFRGYKIKLLIKSMFDTDIILPSRKTRNGKTVSVKTAPTKNDNTNSPLLLLIDNKEVYTGAIFIKEFNMKLGTSYRLTQDLKTRFDKLFLEYNYKDVLKALDNAMSDPFHKENNFNNLTPEFITRPEKLERYINYNKAINIGKEVKQVQL